MSTESIVVAVGDYDQTRDLTSGAISIDETQVIALASPEEIFARSLAGEFAASEMSLAVLSNLISRADHRFVGLPIFPARSFRHGAIYVSKDGATVPADLAATRIGIPVWAQTAGVVVRDFLAHQYSLDLTAITWVRAGVDVAGRPEPVQFDPGPYKLRSEPERTLDELLLTGEVDAVISARPPASIEQQDPRVRRMFDDPTAEEQAFFRDTGVFPIMHVLVIRRQVLEARPRLAAELVGAFTDAKDRSLARASASTVPSYPLPWAPAQSREARSLLGDDFWPYGVEPNRAALTSFLRAAYEQRITHRLLDLQELFIDPTAPAVS
jgi:4,5-dihydroxyphthalate decarboxylase